MTDIDFRRLLAKLDGYYQASKIGSSGQTYVAIGSLLGDAKISDLKKQLKNEEFSVDIRSVNGTIEIRARKDEPFVVQWPAIPKIHVILFLATVFTTILAGTIMEGGNPFKSPSDILMGIPFSFTLMLILGTHEFGHYYFARKHKVDATLPYFIPAPTFIGTFGAFIKIKSPIYRKDALIQIGAAGPIAGFLIAVPALAIGLVKSTVVENTGTELGIILGDSILMKILVWITHPGLGPLQDILLHPIAFAGWIGLLVTMLNLLPIGQLDGGHVAYAFLGRKHDRIAKLSLLALIPLSLFSINWLIWGALILLLMRTTKHPPVYDVDVPLSDKNKMIGYICLAIFILCFIPTPFN
jgi:membrane-associated protease RseP (regulator of RpoE activity)